MFSVRYFIKKNASEQKKEPMAGLEPATYPLRRDCSTIELHRRIKFERLEGIEPSTYPWEGHVLPLNHSRN